MNDQFVRAMGLIRVICVLFLMTGCEEVNDSPTPIDYVPDTTILPTPMIFATNTPSATMTPTVVIAGTPIARATRTVVPPTPISWAIRVSNVPLFQQQQTLTCEEAAAAMASRGKFTETQLVSVMPRNDNPFLGIRGRTNAPVFGGINDYGVYASGLDKGLGKLGFKTEILYKQKYEDFLQATLAHLRADRPVVWWTTWHQTTQKPVSVKTSDGTPVKVVPYEHAVAIVGTTNLGFVTHDPYDGSIRIVSWADHKRASGYFDNMALVLKLQ
jgi:uncharacterized protein YvpB